MKDLFPNKTFKFTKINGTEYLSKDTHEMLIDGERQKKKNISTTLIFIILAIGLVIGIPIGMGIQQVLLIDGLIKMMPALDKMNVDINLNETFIMEETERIAMNMINISKGQCKGLMGNSTNQPSGCL